MKRDLPTATEERDTPSPHVSDEHLRYAKWLARGTWFGFAVMAIGFLAYVGGALDPHVPLDGLPALWSQPAASYLQAAGIRSGWGWAALLHKADMLNLVGVALLAGCSALALVAVIPLYARQRERVLVAVCVLEIVVMTVAASNLVSISH
jgi:hypothetical protein